MTTSRRAAFSLGVAIALTVISFCLAYIGIPKDHWLHAFFFCSMIQPLIFFSFSMGASEVILRRREVQFQAEAAKKVYAIASSETVESHQLADRLQDYKGSIAVNRVSSVIRYIESSKPTPTREEVHSYHKAQAEIDESQIEPRYRLISIALNAILALAFIGSVSGLSFATTKFSDVISSGGNIDQILVRLQPALSALGSAMWTTLWGLILHLLLKVGTIVVQGAHTKLLGQIYAWTQTYSMKIDLPSSGQVLTLSVASVTEACVIRYEEVLQMVKSTTYALTESAQQFAKNVESSTEILGALREVPEDLTRLVAVCESICREVESSAQHSKSSHSAIVAEIKDVQKVVKSTALTEVLLNRGGTPKDSKD